MPVLEACLSPVLLSNTITTNKTIVVIDVIRASTSICTALQSGAEKILPVAKLDKALSLKNKDYLIAGERDGFKISEADFGNSPIDFFKSDLHGKNMVLTTTNGTQAIHAVQDYYELIIGGLVNFSAVVSYLSTSSKDIIFLCSGWKNTPNIEDTLVAGKMISALKESGNVSVDGDQAHIAEKLYDSAKPNLLKFILDNSPRLNSKYKRLTDDFKFCVETDKFDNIPILQNDHLVNK